MRLQKLLIAIALCLCLSVVVSAHPGRTDSDGGHFNHDTGEYHYHHGYSAHQHYDKDGDGVLDCPYTFTGKPSSSENNSGSYTIKKSPSDKNESSQDETEPVKKNNSKKSKDYTWLFSIIGCFVLYGVVLLIGEIKWRLKK